MLAKVHSAQVTGLDPRIIDVEIDISNGLKSFTLVGLPDKAVEEAKDRIGAAIKNSGFQSPQKGNKKIVVSLAPADVKKEGPLFDLAIAMSYLLAVGDIAFDSKGKLFLGELSLDGRVRPIKGTLLLARAARDAGMTEVYVPIENAREAALIPDIFVFGVSTLAELVAHFSKNTNAKKLVSIPQTILEEKTVVGSVDWSDIRGQESAKRGLLIAAAGGHNIAMYGPPGTGKTMLARAFNTILPPLYFDESLEVTGIHSVAGILNEELATRPPLRAPHHTASHIAVVGGGAIPRPGEITLAHRGVLFLDEFPEFDRRVIESLRQPLEDRIVSVSRARGSLTFPAHFILIATMNPCPCGNAGTKGKVCICQPAALERYRRKLSGPIIDRIDLWVDVPNIDYEKLSGKRTGERGDDVRAKVIQARNIQKARFANTKVKTNAAMSVRDLENLVPLAENEKKLLNESAQKMGLSARSYHRIIKLARTIADLDGSETVKENHLLEALQYRPKNFNAF